MKISVIGTGYVGAISAAGFAKLGNEVVCIDIDPSKIEKINRGVPPIFEEGLEEHLKDALKSKKLEGRTDYSSIPESNVVLISVGTPSNSDGSMDVRYIRAAAEQIAKEISKSRFNVIVVRSTVVPGTTEEVVGKTLESITGGKIGKDFGLAMIPEFLKEGTAIEDFFAPDRIVIGCNDERTKAILSELHKDFECPKLFVNIKTAEMIKYASNSFLATKVSFTNEIASICEKIGIDVDDVMKGVGMDTRIGSKFLVAGAGFGGSCFPKDVKALIHHANQVGVKPAILESVMELNKRQQTKLVDMLTSKVQVKGKTIAVLGLAFKTDTDDIRESSSLPIIQRLLDAGAKVRAYDPQAMPNMKKPFPSIYYASSWSDCLTGCDAALLITAWKEFINSASDYKKALEDAPLFDARRILPTEEAKKAGLQYYTIGRGSL